jgi:hypothetical protein
MEELLLLIKPLIEVYGGKSGLVLQVIAFIGSARVILKPWQVIEPMIKDLIKATPTMKDDEVLEKVSQSKVAKWLKFALDYLLSIKIK